MANANTAESHMFVVGKKTKDQGRQRGGGGAAAHAHTHARTPLARSYARVHGGNTGEHEGNTEGTRRETSTYQADKRQGTDSDPDPPVCLCVCVCVCVCVVWVCLCVYEYFLWTDRDPDPPVCVCGV
jgi:hypothetical protein